VAVALPIVVLVGIGYAGIQMFPLAMLPDVIAADETASGERRAGVFTGIWTAAETLGLAVGPALLAGLLALAVYVSSTGSDVVQSGTAVTAVRIGFSLVPAVVVLLSLLVLRRYDLRPPAAVPSEEVAPWRPTTSSPSCARCRPATCRRTAAP
jgi:Na+/melibiose symporter-like transporter